MDNKSRKERERLKEEYKEHYRKIKDIKEKGQRSGYIRNVNEALKNMNSSGLLSSADRYLDQVRAKMVMMEARLDVAMDQLLNTDPAADDEETVAFEESLRKKRASETLNTIKRDIGLLYRELEEQANEYRAEKTIGRKTESSSDS